MGSLRNCIVAGCVFGGSQRVEMQQQCCIRPDQGNGSSSCSLAACGAPWVVVQEGV